MNNVGNAGCACSRKPWKLTSLFLISELINQWINQSNVSRTAYPPLKTNCIYNPLYITKNKGWCP